MLQAGHLGRSHYESLDEARNALCMFLNSELGWAATITQLRWSILLYFSVLSLRFSILDVWKLYIWTFEKIRLFRQNLQF